MNLDEFKEYLKEADHQARDRVQRAEAYIAKQDKMLYGLLAVIAAMAMALFYMAPLKQTIVEVVVLDRSTGVIESPKRVEDATEDLDEAWLKHYAHLFIRAREGYAYDASEDNYYTAAAFMSPELQQEWSDKWVLTNKQSPLNVYGRNTRVSIEIISTTPIKNDAGKIRRVSVRFAKKTKSAATPEEIENRIATYSFRYVDVAKEKREREINPVGFQITDYRSDPETIQPQAAKVEQ